jgi:hypothetical protein
MVLLEGICEKMKIMMMTFNVTCALLVTSVRSSGHFKQLNTSFEYLTHKALYSTSRCFLWLLCHLLVVSN